MQLLKEIGDHLSVRMMMVSHDAGDMLSWADDLIIIKEGKILQRGTPLSLYHHPLNVHVAGLLGEYNLCDGSVVNMLLQKEAAYAVNKKFIIRPEHIFVSDNRKGVKAEVTEILFKGGYYLVRCYVNIQDTIIFISLPSTSHLRVGAEIFIYTSPNYIIHL